MVKAWGSTSTPCTLMSNSVLEAVSNKCILILRTISNDSLNI